MQLMLEAKHATKPTSLGILMTERYVQAERGFNRKSIKFPPIRRSARSHRVLFLALLLADLKRRVMAKIAGCVKRRSAVIA